MDSFSQFIQASIGYFQSFWTIVYLNLTTPQVINQVIFNDEDIPVNHKNHYEDMYSS